MTPLSCPCTRTPSSQSWAFSFPVRAAVPEGVQSPSWTRGAKGWLLPPCLESRGHIDTGTRKRGSQEAGHRGWRGWAGSWGLGVVPRILGPGAPGGLGSLPADAEAVALALAVH